MSRIWDALLPLRSRSSDGAAVVTFTSEQLGSGAAILGRALKSPNVAILLESGQVTVAASRPLPLDRWLNVRLNIVPNASAMPHFRVKVGKLAIPQSISDAVIWLAVKIARYKQPELPDPYAIIHRMSVGSDRVTFSMQLPPNTHLLAQTLKLISTPIDSRSVAKAYCQLSKEQAITPSTALTEHVRRIFRITGQEADARIGNAIAFVALAHFVTEAEGIKLLGPPTRRMSQCRTTFANPVMLGGRADLAKHWALSAAISTGLGQYVTMTLGEWKELADSRPDGSGFSFVDLAADQSGYRYGRAATMKGAEAQWRARLVNITEPQLLPGELLEQEEGFSAVSFDKEYTSLDARQYQDALQIIEAALTKAGVP